MNKGEKQRQEKQREEKKGEMRKGETREEGGDASKGMDETKDMPEEQGESRW